MTAIEEMAGMDVLCSDKTGTLTLNRLTVDRNLIEVKRSTMAMITIALWFSQKEKKLLSSDTIYEINR